MIIQPTPDLMTKAVTAEQVFNWLLPAFGVVVLLFLFWYIWRYVRASNKAGRVSEFSERTLKRLIDEKYEDETIPFCNKCKMPMRVEIRYKDFLKDSGDFLITRETVEPTLQSLVECDRISKTDKEEVLSFFAKHPNIDQQLFKRYKCPNCSKVQILPYNISEK
ncbi:MAG: hypothetical protein FK734_05280 [Asgard group archaeon]|nr:hypothetical protein [Asgard group archaeon]